MDIEEINEIKGKIQKAHGRVWTTEELQQEFEVLGFMAPYCSVIRRADHQKGTIAFIHSPRFYYDFRPLM